MSNLKVNICQFPTTTLLVDDNNDFLTKAHDFLIEEEIICKFYDDAAKALHYLNKEYKSDPFTNRCITATPDTDIDQFVANFDFRKIHHEIYNPYRFSQISVLSVDYAMPTMNGLDFCRKVQEDFCLKLIMTGEMGKEFAVEAFNEGIIDKFIQKSALNLPELLTKSIHELQYKYFLKLSNAALNKVTPDLYKQTPTCLTDTIFMGFFNNLREKNNIIEYYLLDEHGSFLLLDKQAKPSWLIVKSEKIMADIHEFAELQEASQEIVDGFKNRTIIPYFHTDEEWKLSFDDTKHCLHPATKIDGEQVYYYSYLTDPDAYKLERDKIVSLEKYMKNF